MSVLTKACLLGLLGVAGIAAPTRAIGQLQPYPDAPTIQQPRKKPDKIERLQRIADWSLTGATVADVWTTAHGMDLPTSAYAVPSGTFLAHYYVREAGWTKCFGDRNTLAATTANAALNVGVDLLGKRLEKRGGRWRFAGIALVAGKAALNATAAVHNIRVQAGINQQVRSATGYNGPIAWR